MRTSSLALGTLALLLGSALPGVADDRSALRRVSSLAVNGGDSSIHAHAVIVRPGTYTLRRALTATNDQPLITIAADDVSLDLNGFALTGIGGKQGTGIFIDGRTNVTVRNGSLRNFGVAVHATESEGLRLEGLQIVGEDLPGLPPETGILLVDTRGARVSDNIVQNTFLGVFVRGEGSGGNTIKANTLTGGMNGQLGICYNPAPGGDPATDGPSGDLVAENHIARFRTAIQLSAASVGNIFVRNYLNFFESGIEEISPGSNVLANNQEIELP